VGEQVDECLEEFRAHGRVPLGERRQPAREHGAHGRVVEPFAHAAPMVARQLCGQCFDERHGHVDDTGIAVTGRDAVDGTTGRKVRVQRAHAAAYAVLPHGVGGQTRAAGASGQRENVFDRQTGLAEHDGRRCRAARVGVRGRVVKPMARGCAGARIGVAQ